MYKKSHYYLSLQHVSPSLSHLQGDYHKKKNMNCRRNTLCTDTKELYYDSLLEDSVEKEKRVLVECNKEILCAWLILVDLLD
jgi:hypothetical protein